MGKYDIFLKYLGKEDSFSPEEIKEKLSLSKKEEEIESANVEENLSKVDELLEKLETSPKAVETKAPLTSVEQPEEQIDEEILNELKMFDQTPPDVSQIQEGLAITSYEGPSPEEKEEKKEAVPTGFEEVTFMQETPPQEVTPEVPFEIPVEKTTPPEEESLEEGVPGLSGLFEEISPKETPPEEAAIPQVEMEFPEVSEEISPEIPSLEEHFYEEAKPSEAEIEIQPSEVLEEVEKELPHSPLEEMPQKTMKGEKKEQFEEAYQKVPEERISEEKIEIDQQKALAIRNRINNIEDPVLRRRVRQALIESKLSKEKENSLIQLLILNESDEKIREFMDRNLPEEFVKPEVTKKEVVKKPAKRKVIYTEEIKKQKEIEKALKSFSRFSFVTFFLAILLGFILWKFVWIPSVVDRIYNEGYTALNLKDITTAELKFNRAKEIGGPSIKWYNRYALKYIELKELERARKKFVEALEYDPLNKITIYNFAEYYKNLYPPKFEEALDLYMRLYKKDPNNFEYLDKVAQTYLEWGDKISQDDEKLKKYAEANRLYENYLIKKPKHTSSYFRLLDIAIKLKKQERIDILFDTIDKINKQAVNEKTFTDLARYYLDNRRYDRAKKVFEKLIPYLTPPEKKDVSRALLQSETYYEYGRFLTINLDFLKAIKVLSNSIILNPKNSKAYNLLGEIYLMDEKNMSSKLEARNMFEEAIKNDPLFYKPYANIGHLYFYNSVNFSDPENAFSQAFYYYKIASSLLKGDAKDNLLFYNLGWLYYKYGDYESALQEFSKIYIEDPLNPILSYNIGNIFFMLKKYNLATIQFEKSAEYFETIASKINYINPELNRHRELYTNLARNYNNIGVVYLTLAKRNPPNKDELERLALLNFYKAKDSALRVNQIYSIAEYNIKIILNKALKNREPAFDKELVMKTDLEKFISEFKENLIRNL